MSSLADTERELWREVLSRSGATRSTGDRERPGEGLRQRLRLVVGLLAAGYLALGAV